MRKNIAGKMKTIVGEHVEPTKPITQLRAVLVMRSTPMPTLAVPQMMARFRNKLALDEIFPVVLLIRLLQHRKVRFLRASYTTTGYLQKCHVFTK